MIDDPVAAAPLIASRFGWAAPVAMTHVADGAMGRVWRLDTATTSYAVKELYWAEDADREDALVERQVAFCETARAAGVAAPANLTTETGDYVTALPPDLGGRLVRAYEWIEGRPVTSADRSAAAWAGHTEARIERLAVSPGDQEVDPWSYVSPSAEAWAALAHRCEEAQQPWADRLRQVIPRFVGLADLVVPPDAGTSILTHTDFQRQNVLLDSDGRYVLLDWDDAGPSSCTRALGRLINNWHLHDATVDREGIRATMQGYRAGGGVAELTEVTDFGDSICGYLNYVHGQAELSLDQSQPVELRVEARRRIPDLLNPLPVTTYEEAITAAQDG